MARCQQSFLSSQQVPEQETLAEVSCARQFRQQSEPNCQNGRGTLTLKKESVFSRQALYSIQGFSLESIESYFSPA